MLIQKRARYHKEKRLPLIFSNMHAEKLEIETELPVKTRINRTVSEIYTSEASETITRRFFSEK